ncbi:TPA: CCA tRNA nucleotidyltransferase [Candidatus Bipolaricaulota bacterium]|nr:CCA tRNA nucleotidyltransferase [Candidatus Bipolaricaulota bacterium]
MRIPMEELLSVHPFVGEILERLTRAGHEAVIVGGAVRDAVLAAQAKRPCVFQDVDIATSAPPQEIKRLFHDRPVLTVGEAFGVVVVVAPDGRQYEVATFRSERGYSDGRRPGQVAWTTLEEDLWRRDFTVNGLAARPDGEVIDLVGGLADLTAGVIRTIGDPRERFSEDSLRMLRAVRFACQLGFSIEEGTRAAIAAQAAEITRISWERIRDELVRILSTPRAAQGFKLLDELGLLSQILPEITSLKGVPQDPNYHPEGDVFTHTLLALEVADRLGFSYLVKLGVLFHDAGKGEALARSGGEHSGGHELVGERLAEHALRRLRFPAREIAHVRFLTREHMRAGRLPEMGLGKQVRLLSAGEDEQAPVEEFTARFPLFSDLLRLFICDAEASAHRASAWLPLLSHIVRLHLHVRRVQGLKRARELISGEDLIALGERPGPRLGEILSEIHERILAGEIETRDQALQLAKKLLKGQR